VKKRKWISLALALLCALMLIQNATAMSSTNYQLDWFTPLTSGGGGAASSTNYAVNFTIGQSAIGAANSATYNAGLGFWRGVADLARYYLPMIFRNAP
jgi:hypothetical protein